MLRRFSVNYAIFLIGIDAILVTTALLLSTLLRPQLSALPFAATFRRPIPIPEILYLVFPIVWVAIQSLFSLYDGRRNLRIVDELTSLTLATMLGGVALAGLLYLSYRDISRVQFIFFVLLTYIFMVFWRSIARTVFWITKGKTSSPRRVLIVGAGPVGKEINLQINSRPYLDLNIIGFLDDDPKKRKNTSEVLGTVKDIRLVSQKYQVDDVVIALPSRAHERVTELVTELYDLPVRVWVVPDFFHLALHRAVIEDFAGIPMLDLRAPALSDYQRLIKRIFDLTTTILILIPALPLMGLIALAIWIDDRGTILFKQTRVGENGHLFEIYKYRTMVPNAEKLRNIVEHVDDQGNLIHKARNDPRVTRVGRILRRLSLDELPQFFNVLKGNMSIVGPRPELPYLVDQYKPWQRKRFAVPQGITGWWQIHGRSDKPMHLHTEDDLYYVQNYTIWLDIKILIRTGWIILRGKGAY